MRTRFWMLYVEIKDADCYWTCYLGKTRCANNLIIGFSLFVTLGGMGSWVIWQKYGWIWAAVVAVSQLLASVRFLFPFDARIGALQYFLPDLHDMLIDVEHLWGEIDRKPENYTDDKISKLVLKHTKQLAELEKKYLKDISFPHSKYCNDKASSEMNKYMGNLYPEILERRNEQ